MSNSSRARWLLPIGLAAVPAYHVAYAVQYLTVEQAQRAAFPRATSFAAVTISPDQLQRAAAGDASTPPGWSPKCWEARKGDARVGWLLVDQVIGKTEEITFAVGIDSGGKVRSVEIMAYRESHGGEVRLPLWRRQFVGKEADDPIRLGTDIRNISGATLSCRHVTEGVRRLVTLVDHVLRGDAR